VARGLLNHAHKLVIVRKFCVAGLLKARLCLNMKFYLWKQIVYSIFTGFFGMLLVVLLLACFMPFTATVRYIPWIIGFNTAVAGYTLIDRTRERIRYKKAAGAGEGFLVALTACITLNLMAGYMTGIGLIYWTDLLFFTIIGTGFGWLGAVLFIKYAATKNVEVKQAKK
jgi:hypothetical protein